MPPTITDICLVADDIDDAVDFYTTKLDFRLQSRMPGFADFVREGGVTLALWEANAIREATDVPAQAGGSVGRGVMVAIELPSPAAVDTTFGQLEGRGVTFDVEPRDYPWNARCAYFPGPCGEFWELFAWHEGGKPGMVWGGGTA